MFYHYFIGVQFSNPFTSLLAHGYLAVDIFFVLSGFVMALTYSHMFSAGASLSQYGLFLGRRIARVYPLYLIGTLVAFALISKGLLESPHHNLGSALSANLLMIQVWGISGSLDGPSWSISAEWAAYLLFPLLLAASRNRVARWSAAMLSVGALVAMCAEPPALRHAVSPAALLDIHGDRFGLPVLRCLAEFFLGIVTYVSFTAGTRERIGETKWLQGILCTFMVGLLMIPRTDLLFVLLIPFLIMSLAGNNGLPSRFMASTPMETLGRYSYSIYLIHTLLYPLVGWIHKVSNAKGFGHGQTIGACVGILLTYPLAVLAYRSIENPGRRFLRAVFEGKRTIRGSAATEPSAP